MTNGDGRDQVRARNGLGNLQLTVVREEGADVARQSKVAATQASFWNGTRNLDAHDGCGCPLCQVARTNVETAPEAVAAVTPTTGAPLQLADLTTSERGERVDPPAPRWRGLDWVAPRSEAVNAAARRQGYTVLQQRPTLMPLRRLWIAWRTKRAD